MRAAVLIAAAGLGLRSLGRHRLRSALTMLGMVLGVAAVVVMVAVGNGARDRIDTQIRSLGANLVAVSSGSVKQGVVRLGGGTHNRIGEDDAKAIEAEIPDLVAVAPLLYGHGQMSSGGRNWASRVRGVTDQYFVAREWPVAGGREMFPEDQERAQSVAWLGATVARMLFEDEEPVGAVVRIRGVPFAVVGVLTRKGQSLDGDDQDDVVLVPLTAARRHLVGKNPANPRFLHSIYVKFDDRVTVDVTIERIGDLLRQRHRVLPGQDEPFMVRNLADVADLQQSAMRNLALLLAIVASLSLLVGGIGIMNIMLVSVVERTREVGLRMAVGARRRDILVQFLMEALALALGGGAMGALAGWAGAHAVGAFTGWEVRVDAASVALSVGFAAAVGVFFGYYPARRAANLNPLCALRRD